MADVSGEDGGPPAAVANAIKQAQQAQMRFQAALDRTTPFVGKRWATTGGLLVLFMLRIVISQGWYIGECGGAGQK